MNLSCFVGDDRKSKINKDLIYNYKGVKTKAPYNTSVWNSVYVADNYRKIGPILNITIKISNQYFLKNN